MGERIIVDIAFAGRVIEWRGPAPFYFVALPTEHCGEVRRAARAASYGWGVIPVAAAIGDVAFATSLFPKHDAYLLPLRTAVRRQASVVLGDDVAVTLRIVARD